LSANPQSINGAQASSTPIVLLIIAPCYVIAERSAPHGASLRPLKLAVSLPLFQGLKITRDRTDVSIGAQRLR
jgi:hypothetical protein